MKSKASIVVVLMAAISMWPTPSLAADSHADDLRGTWGVVAVRTDPALKVAALLDDDPSYMHASIVVTDDAIKWRHDKTNGSGNYEDCPSPTYKLQEGSTAVYTVACAGHDWVGSFRMRGASHASLTWYDGGILSLVRTSGPGR
jgi:hypothetical protein